MSPLAIITRFDVPYYGAPRIVAYVSIALRPQFEFEGGDEAFGDRIVITIAGATHTREQAMVERVPRDTPWPGIDCLCPNSESIREQDGAW